MLQITQSSQRDGYTFSIDPRSRVELKHLKPAIRPLPRIFIAFDDFGDFQRERGDLYEHVAQLLTRLSESELHALGGYEIINPLTEEVLFHVANA